MQTSGIFLIKLKQSAIFPLITSWYKIFISKIGKRLYKKVNDENLRRKAKKLYKK